MTKDTGWTPAQLVAADIASASAKARMLAAAATELGRKGGASRSDRKIAAARANGRKGGRPRTITTAPASEPPTDR